jgi:large subunit ribosomal protein L25
MSASFELKAANRGDLGKGAMRRLRKTGQVPGVVYGGNREPSMIQLRHDELMHDLENDAFYSHILNLDVDGKAERVVLKDLQRHPAKDVLMHVDFLRVSEDQPVTMRVPLHFVGAEKSVGIKMGGSVSVITNDVIVKCLPKDLPDAIEVDLSAMRMGRTIHLSGLKLPEGVSLVALSHGDVQDYDQAVVTMLKARGMTSSDVREAEKAFGITD